MSNIHSIADDTLPFFQFNQRRLNACKLLRLDESRFAALLPGLTQGRGDLSSRYRYELNWQHNTVLAVISARQSQLSIVAVAFGESGAAETWSFLRGCLPWENAIRIAGIPPPGIWIASAHLPALPENCPGQVDEFCRLEEELGLALVRFQSSRN